METALHKQAENKGNNLPEGFVAAQWQPGKSGNPKGRPRKRLLSEELTDVLEERIDATDLNSPTRLRLLAEKLVALSTGGNTKAIEILAKLYEPRRMRAEVENLNVQVNIQDELSDFVAGLPEMLATMGRDPNDCGQLALQLGRRTGGLPRRGLMDMLDTLGCQRAKDFQTDDDAQEPQDG
jgi:hypothetical protein